jgi:hypothetical protein
MLIGRTLGWRCFAAIGVFGRGTDTNRPLPEFEPYGYGMLDEGDGNLVRWEFCCNSVGKSVVVVAAPPVFEQHHSGVALLTEAPSGARTLDGLLPLSHPEKHAERFTGSSL